MRLFSLFLIFSMCIACGGTDPIINPPSSPVFSMDPFEVVEGEENKSIFITLRLSKVSTESVNVTLETVDISANEGVDYLGFDNQTIVFEPGDVQANCQITIIGDEVPEQDEEFGLRIKSISGATSTTSQISITIENDDQGFDITIPNGGYSTPTTYPGMDIFWRDEFDADELNEEDWTYEIGNGNWGWGNDELEFYRRENTKLQDGHLIIQARNENFSGFQYTSSRIKTQNKVDFTYGRVDIRAVLPEGQGIWPALWMLGSNITQVSWPQCGEIDIMELIGHLPSKTHGTAHYANSGGGHLQSPGSTSLTGGQKFSQEFHVFSIVWKENLIEWFLDDKKFHSITPTSIGLQNPYPFNEDFFFIFNVAVGGQWPGSPDASTVFPQNMIVDYIRVFKED